ncbi:MAG: DUF4837 family protein [candidate division KSB1 bacterium]|nr:DUF4837 family protein [candidate division KSB1 bacterium]MDZ7318264.1 DUF4837 family protein [candidate division KSB1 bacterium]MDZ7340144.1 DUF4837 family protein [candidate division KSB1 bacterium]
MKRSIVTCILLSSLISLVLVFNGCLRSKTPLGLDSEIRVVADSTIWQQAEPTLREIFEKTENMPQPEKLYLLIPEEPNKAKRFKNIIFIATLEATDKLSATIVSGLSDQARSRVQQGSILFVKRDEWVKGQLLLFLIGRDMPTLLSQMDAMRSEIFFQIDDYWNQFHKNILYRTREQVDVEKQLLKNYGWTIRVPIDFQLDVQSAKDRFVMFRRTIPYRWFSVFWIDATDPSIITKEWCIAKRNEIGKLFFENEVVEETYEPVIAEETIFLNRRALRLKGLWKDDAKVAGGPFRLYCFFDRPTERIYFIDMHIFAPNVQRNKLHYFRQMEIIANTFRTTLDPQ